MNLKPVTYVTITLVFLAVITQNISSKKKLREEILRRGKNEVFARQAQMYKRQIEEGQALWLESRKRSHDLKQHMIVLKEYAGKNRNDELNNYLDTLVACHSTPYWKTKSGNIVIDSLVGYKMKMAAELKIKLTAAFEMTDRLPFEDYDLTVIIGNILDNAIEAVAALPEAERRIDLQIRFARNILSIKITNPYHGNFINESGKFFTQKPDKENHGFGLASVRNAVQKYQGTVRISGENNFFALTAIMYGKEKLNA